MRAIRSAGAPAMTSGTRPGRRVLAAVTVAAVTAAGCSVPLRDKSGGEVRTLRFATIDVVDETVAQTFVRAVERLSAGRLEVTVDRERFGRGEAGDEAALVASIASGEVDGGWPASRAFARAGVTGLEVLETPFLITSYAAQAELVDSPSAEALLRRLDGSGIRGLALTVGPLRRPFSTDEPLVSLTAWKGRRIGTKNSPVQEASVRALGGEPVPTGFADRHGLDAATPVLAAELDVHTYWSSEVVGRADRVPADVVLWPKVPVLAVSDRLWNDSTDEERGWLEDAAALARAASRDGPALSAAYESSRAGVLCDRGLDVTATTAAQRRELVDAVTAVRRDLLADSVAEAIAGIAARHQTDTLPLSDGCGAGPIPPPSAAPPPSSGPPATAAALPSGTYRVRITRADLARVGASNGDGWTGTWTLRVSAGRYELACRAVDDPPKDCGNGGGSDPLEAGPVTTTGDVAAFVDERSGLSYSARWRTTADGLAFEAADPAASSLHLTLLPWVRIG